MARFSQVLQRVDRRLEVREPERSRILLEVAADLEALYRAYRDRGASEREARHRAEVWLAPDGASRAELRRLHMPLAARLLSLLSGVARGRLETALLTILSLGAIAGGLAALRAIPGLWPPGPAAVPVLVLGGLGLGLLGRGVLDLLTSAGEGLRAARWLPGVLVTAVAAPVAGALGAAVTLNGALGTAGAAGPELLWRGVATAAGTATLGLVVALVLGLGGFWLAVRHRLVREARAELEAVTSIPSSDPRGG